jgi:hypothetical protein
VWCWVEVFEWVGEEAGEGVMGGGMRLWWMCMYFGEAWRESWGWRSIGWRVVFLCQFVCG